MTDSSRDQILARIAASLGRDPAATGTTASATASAAYARLPRDYRAASDIDAPSASMSASMSASSSASIAALFADRLHEYNAACTPVASEAAIAEAVAASLTARSLSSLAVVSGIPPQWLPTGFDFASAEPLSAVELDRQPGILTACSVAIAETGSLVLQSGPRQGLRLHTLVPDFHLCVVFERQLVATVPEAFHRLTPDLPTTFISGPSATADIEMTRIKGVHGPRSLHVLLVAD